MQTKLLPLVSILALTTLMACGTDDPVGDLAANDVADTHHQDINWFTGSVDEAFSIAKQQNKPLFFYWGAVWCPPCQEIKHTVFEHPKFISQSELFVPVYLDGDTEQAQLVGEQFAVQGYPTMIVFNSAGEEITRIPGGIDTRRYLDVLSLSLARDKNMDLLIEQAINVPESLTGDELTLLAFYSWGQDNVTINDDQSLSLLKSLAFLPGAENQLAISRLLLSYLSKQIDLERDDLSGDQKQDVLLRVHNLLAEPDSVLANVDYLSFYSAEIVNLLTLTQGDRDLLVQQWIESLSKQRVNPVLSSAERLGTWLAPIDLYWLQNPQQQSLPADLAAAIESEVQELDGLTKGDARQSVINRAGNVLRAAGLYPQAKKLITKELMISQSPYYFMSSLAEIAEETEDFAGIIEWREKAYRAATGKATRFQWGVEYVSALIQYQPQATEVIADTASSLFDNLDQGSDVFSGRNYGRLKTLLANLKQWQAQARDQTLVRFVARLQSFCDQTDRESRQYQQCSSLLVSL